MSTVAHLPPPHEDTAIERAIYLPARPKYCALLAPGNPEAYCFKSPGHGDRHVAHNRDRTGRIVSAVWHNERRPA